MAVTRFLLARARSADSSNRTRSFYLADTAAEVPQTNVVPGDYALALDTGAYQIATGPTSWSAAYGIGGMHPNLATHVALGLFSQAGEDVLLAALDPFDQYELKATKGVAFGHASLNGTAKVPIIELPFGGTPVDVGITNDPGSSLTLALSDHVHRGHTHVVNETPGGVINGLNATFVLATIPQAGSLMLFKNGLLMRAGSGNDYTLSGLTLVFESDTIPMTGSILLASYIT